jgi:hypothetical protein
VEDARAARRAEAADPWRRRDRLPCAWREPKASGAGPPLVASRWHGEPTENKANTATTRTDSNGGLMSMGIQLTKAAFGAAGGRRQVPGSRERGVNVRRSHWARRIS